MSAQTPIRVLVIDDSAYSRRTITRMLETSPLVEVVGWARDGEEALRKALQLRPDLVTLDLEMPRMDGFTLLRLLMAKRPTPVLVVSGRSGDEEVFRALELGAVDFVAKPSLRAAPELATIQEELIRKVHATRQLRMDKVRDRISQAPALVRARDPVRDGRLRVVAIGSSTGGPAALMQVFGAFGEAPDCAFVVSQHMPEGFTRGFAERIDRLTPVAAHEAEGGEALTRGSVLLAPGGHHLEFELRGATPVTRLVERGPEDKYAPSVDRMFESAAKHFGSDLLAVVLTGMGDDGRRGVRAVRDAGGSVIAESEETAVIFGMPQQAIRTGAVDAVLPLRDIAPAIQAGLPRGRDARIGEGSA
ncbi:MAG TPA: chemotaxis response regulator protein-glutamate methylesterase [Myxococcota bacterium]|nr:chemotaxis response regulator protein-glutamate methylesterase [Myxococcota bacterium]